MKPSTRIKRKHYEKDVKRFKCVRGKTIKDKMQYAGLKMLSYAVLKLIERKPKTIYIYDEHGRFVNTSRYRNV